MEAEFSGVIEGVLYWNYLNKKDVLSNKYKCTIGNLDRDTAEKLKKAGAKIKEKDNIGLSVMFGSQNPIPVKDSALNELTSAQISKIGNGSLCKFNVQVKPSGYSNPQQNLWGVQVLNLVEYVSDKGFRKEEGFKAQDFEEGSIND